MRESVLNRTVIITLIDDEWDPLSMPAPRSPYVLPEDAPNPTLAAAIIDALVSEQAEPGGFNSQLALNRSQFLLKVASETELRIDLPLTVRYDIVQPETIAFDIPPLAVLSRGSISADPKWVILPSVGVPSVRNGAGELITSFRELTLQVNTTELHVEMLSDGFVEAVGQARRRLRL